MLKRSLSLPLLLITLLLGAVVYAERQLLMVLEMFRHGHRAPCLAALGWCNKNELTEVGMRQLYLSGLKLREYYGDHLKFLPETYNYINFYTRSTMINRTLMSCMAHYQGLFPLGTGPKLPENYPESRAVPPYTIANQTIDLKALGPYALPNGEQRVPIITMDSKDDKPMQAPFVCPLFEKFYKGFEKQETWLNFSKIFEPYYPQIAKATEFPLENMTLTVTSKLYDVLLADYYQNYRLAVPYKSDLWNNMSLAFNIWLYYLNAPDDKFVKLAIWPTFQEFFEAIDARLNGTHPNMKWYTYSGHDTNLLYMLMAFNLTSWKCLIDNHYGANISPCLTSPPLASVIIWELSRDPATNKAYIEFKYNNQSYSICGNNQTVCEYEELKKQLTSRFYVENWDEECGLQPRHQKRVIVTKASSLVWVMILLGVVITILIGGLVVMSLKKDRTTVSSIEIESPLKKT